MVSVDVKHHVYVTFNILKAKRRRRNSAVSHMTLLSPWFPPLLPFTEGSNHVYTTTASCQYVTGYLGETLVLPYGSSNLSEIHAQFEL